MRIALRIIVAAVAMVMVGTLLPAASAAPQPTAAAVQASKVTASAAPVVPAALFGQHVGRIVQGKPSTLLRVGSIRLWDSGVTWQAIEFADDRYRWARLDAAVKHAEGLGAAEILYTLGSTPRWAASDPNSKLALYGPGSNSHPKADKLYLDYLKVVAQRYKGRITAYQVWNEANLRDFYLGTPKQMANLTKQAYTVLKSVDPKAKLVAASTTVRDKGPVGKFGKAYGAAMRKVGWPVDAVSAHFYPPATKGPATRVAYIKKIKKYYAKHGAKRKPLWDTEMNYGDTRSYMKVKKVYTGETARTYVARTYLDSMRYGVSRVFWYGWDMHMLGTDMTNRTNSGVSAGGATFLKMQEWMVGKSWLGCKTKAKVTTCKLRARDGSVTAIRWSSKVKKYKVPKGVTAIHLLNGSIQPVVKGQKVQLTPQPVAMSGPKP